MSAGKGSTPRPRSVSKEEYDRRWEATFKRDEVEPWVEAVADVMAERAATEAEMATKIHEILGREAGDGDSDGRYYETRRIR